MVVVLSCDEIKKVTYCTNESDELNQMILQMVLQAMPSLVLVVCRRSAYSQEELFSVLQVAKLIIVLGFHDFKSPFSFSTLLIK